jgi:hypothetical protein
VKVRPAEPYYGTIWCEVCGDHTPLTRSEALNTNVPVRTCRQQKCKRIAAGRTKASGRPCVVCGADGEMFAYRHAFCATDGSLMLGSCMKKYPALTEADALDVHPDAPDYRAYLCRICRHWHRTAGEFEPTAETAIRLDLIGRRLRAIGFPFRRDFWAPVSKREAVLS